MLNNSLFIQLFVLIRTDATNGAGYDYSASLTLGSS